MPDLSMGVIETRFAELIWAAEPISSTTLWKQCQQVLGWKKSTTFTVLKRLCEKGIFRNENGVVSSVISREEYNARQSRQFVEEAFAGSLPAFLTAFTSGKTLSPEEVAQLRQLVAQYGEE